MGKTMGDHNLDQATSASSSSSFSSLQEGGMSVESRESRESSSTDDVRLETRTDRSHPSTMAVSDPLEAQDLETSSEASDATKSIWPALIFVMIVIAGLVGWRAYTLSQEQLAEAERQPALDEADPGVVSLPVRVVEAQTAPIQGWVTSNGQVRAIRGKHLLFEASGEVTYLAQIDGRDLREGDFVQAGQLLATIDDRTYQSNIRTAESELVVAQESQSQAEARLAQAQANLAAAESDLRLAEVDYQRQLSLYDVEVAQSRANLTAAESDLQLARSEYNRGRELFEAGAISASEVDVYENRVNQSESAVEVAQQSLAKADQVASGEIDTYRNRVEQSETNIQVNRQSVLAAEDDVRTAAARVDSAQASLNNAEVALEDTQLVSPIDGIVAFLNIREGDYWSTQSIRTTDYQSVVETVPIIVVNPDELEVVVEVPAFEGARLKTGQNAYIVPDERMSQASVSGLTDETLVTLATAEGSLFAVNPAVTPGGRATEVRIRITDNVESLRVGAQVSVWIEAETNPSATTIPLGTVVFRERDPFIFVVDGDTNTVEQRPIRQGIEGLGSIEISSGVSPGELVVTEGRNRLVDGAPIEIIGQSTP